MAVQDIQGKLQKNCMAILRAALFGLKRRNKDKISLKIFFCLLVFYVNVINKVLAREFGEI